MIKPTREAVEDNLMTWEEAVDALVLLVDNREALLAAAIKRISELEAFGLVDSYPWNGFGPKSPDCDGNLK